MQKKAFTLDQSLSNFVHELQDQSGKKIPYIAVKFQYESQRMVLNDHALVRNTILGGFVTLYSSVIFQKENTWVYPPDHFSSANCRACFLLWNVIFCWR